MSASKTTTAAPSLLDDVLRSTRAAETQRSRLELFEERRDLAGALVAWLGLRPGDPIPRTRKISQRLAIDLALIDDTINRQVNALIHHDAFQRLESGWRGLRYLVERLEHSDDIKVRVFDASWQELAKDLEKAIEFDQSTMFRKVYSEEFGMAGGQPFSVLLGNYEVSHRPRAGNPVDDVRCLRGAATVAAAAFAPLIVAAHPSLFGLDHLEELSRPIDLSRVFAQPEYTAWNALRDLEDTRFLAITLPRVLGRAPWPHDAFRRDGFCFREQITSNDDYLWTNACFAYGAVLIRSFQATRWLADIRGVRAGEDGGGIVATLPNVGFELEPAHSGWRPPFEVVITDTRERTVAGLGLLPLCACYGTNHGAFYSSVTLQRPEQGRGAEADANARLSAMLQYILCTSRIAHYVKVICRDRAGSFDSAVTIERYLTDWLFDRSMTSSESSRELQAKYPLREARVEVRESPGKPGAYTAVIHLRPHFQLDQMTSSIRLVTEILTAK